MIPRYRYLGNAVLSLLTKIASGYWHVADSQSGYTAISLPYLELLDLDRIYQRYGFPNDLLVHLNVWNARVRDYPSRPIYGVGERSGIRLRKVVPTISWLLVKGFFWRMRVKYVIRDFHPLVFFYALGFLATLLGLGLGIAELVLRIMGNAITPATIVLVALLLISGSQFTLFAMWFDMESNKDLGGRGRRSTDPRPRARRRRPARPRSASRIPAVGRPSAGTHVRAEVDVREALQQLGRAALLEPGAAVDDEVLLQSRRVDSRALERERDAGIPANIAQLPLAGREVPGDELVAIDPAQTHVTWASSVERDQVRERAGLDQLAGAIGQHLAQSGTRRRKDFVRHAPNARIRPEWRLASLGCPPLS